MTSSEKAGQVPEEEVEALARKIGEIEGWHLAVGRARELLEAAYPAIRDHFLQEFREAVAEMGKHRVVTVQMVLDRLDSPSQPVQEEQ